MALNKFNSKSTILNTRYIVRTSDQRWARTLSGHSTLVAAYKRLVSHHTEHYKLHRWPMAQLVRAIISTAAEDTVIMSDIARLVHPPNGPIRRNRKRLPLPIVVHQWQPKLNCYIAFGENS